MPVGPLEGLSSPSNAGQENAVAVPAIPAGLPATKNRFAFKNKHLYAASLVFLQMHEGSPPPDCIPDELFGKVVHCPTTRNGQTFEIQWLGLHHGSQAGIPSNLLPHLRRFFPKKDYSAIIRKLIVECDFNNRRPTPAHAPALPPPGISTGTTTAPPIQVVLEIPIEILQTPEHTTRQAAAALYTAGSTSASISTLGVASAMASRRSATRSTTQDDQDSDDNSTQGEDEFVVDFSQNFWASREQNLNMGEDGAFDEHDGGDVEYCPYQAERTDYARLLKDVIDFQFQEIRPEDAAAIGRPPKLYEGESGLRRGVASTFDTPFESFRKAGFTERVVATYVMHSNE